MYSIKIHNQNTFWFLSKKVKRKQHLALFSTVIQQRGAYNPWLITGSRTFSCFQVDGSITKGGGGGALPEFYGIGQDTY